jgi:N-acetylglutamate synthase-like GNAT family acetyltransferase
MELRKAKHKEFNQIYMLGYDMWGEDALVSDYLVECNKSEKYQSGEWYILVQEHVVLSALIVYKKSFALSENYYGIGSVATNPKYRKKGYASKLLSCCCQKFKNKGINGLYLFSDIDVSFYEKLGFDVIENANDNCMINTFDSKTISPKNLPNYF